MLFKYKNNLSNLEKNSSMIFLVIALILWMFSGLKESIDIEMQLGNIMLVYIAIGGFMLSIAAHRLKWNTLIYILQGYLALGMLALISLLSYYKFSHPFGEIGSISILLFFAVHYFQLYIFEKSWQMQTHLHMLSLWVLTLIGAKELSYLVSLLTQNETYINSSWGIFFIFMITIILKRNQPIPMIFAKYLSDYRSFGVIGIIVMLSIWEYYCLSTTAGPSPLPYIPFLNPLEIVQTFGLFLIYDYFKKEENIYYFLGVSALLFATVVLARSIHHYTDIDYNIISLLQSVIFQMSLSILWSIIAMLTMIKANSLNNRTLWIAGAGLIGVVIVKLFLIELANSGSVERIISFIAVGIFLLLIGYFAPLPPVKQEIKESN